MARAAKTKPKVKTAAAAVVPAAEPVSAFSIGDGVTHAMFGDGTVTAASGTTLTIAFDKFGTKQVLDSFLTKSR